MNGERVGDYKLQFRLGEGASAQVWLGVNPTTGTRGAVKILRVEAGAASRERFLLEARILAGLSHPHIVSVYDVGPDYIVMAYIEGTDLRQRLQTPMAPGDALRLIIQVGSAIAYAHESGVLHRDIKPANILLDTQDNAFLADFGIAQLVGVSSDDYAGTRAYMAPEAVAGDVSSASDQYALGRTLQQMLLGAALRRDEHDEDLADLPKHLPERLHAALKRALAPDPKERFPSVRELVDELSLIDVREYVPRLVFPEPRWDPARFAWAAEARHTERLSHEVSRADFGLADGVERGGFAEADVDAFRKQTEMRDVGFSLWSRSNRLGAPNDPTSLARCRSVVVILPGMAYTRFTWTGVAERICRDHGETLVLSCELNGFHDSVFADDPPSPEAMAPRGQMKSVLTLLELLGFRDLPTTIVAHSLSSVAAMSMTSDELGANVNRLLITPIVPFANYRWQYYMTGGALLMSMPWLNPVFSPITQMRMARVVRTLPEVLQREALDELARYSPRTFGRGASVWRTAGSVDGDGLRRTVWMSGTDDAAVSRATTERALKKTGFDPANFHWCVSRDHYPHLPTEGTEEDSARSLDQILTLVSLLLRDAQAETGVITEDTVD